MKEPKSVYEAFYLFKQRMKGNKLDVNVRTLVKTKFPASEHWTEQEAFIGSILILCLPKGGRLSSQLQVHLNTTDLSLCE